MADNEFETQETNFFTKLTNSLNLDEKTKEKSKQFYLQYKNIQKDVSFNFQVVFPCCILIAAQSQIMQTLEGKIIRGIGISINQIIKKAQENSWDSKFCLKDFLFQLKQILNSLKLDLEVQNILKSAIKRFVFIHLFHCKFTEILNSFLVQKIDYREAHSSKDKEETYLKKSKEMGWLLFIVLQTLMFEYDSKDVGPNACLLLSVLYELLSTMPKKFFMKAVLNDALLDISQQEIDSQKLVEALCQEMKIKHIDVFFEFYEKQFKDQLHWLSRQENIVISRESLKHFEVFREDYIDQNYGKLEQFYQKNIGFEKIDERYFLHEKSLQTVTKIVPFTPLPQNVSYFNDNNSNSFETNRRLFMRNVNFETSGANNFSMKSTLSEIRNKKYPESPQVVENPIPQTPMSQQIELYNWLHDSIKKIKPNKEQDYIIPHLQKYLDAFQREDELKTKILELVDNTIKKVEQLSTIEKLDDKKQQIFLLYLRVLDEMIRIEEKKLEEKNMCSIEYFEFVRNLDFHKSLTAICIETIFFINNKDLDIQNLFNLVQIEAFDFWKMINSFVKYDKKMPLPLKDHFFIIEKMILFGYAWKSGSALDKLIKNFEEKSKNDLEKIESSKKCLVRTEIFLSHSEEIFFKKVIYYTAAQILDICDVLGLSETITEFVWQTITFILSNETRLLINRNINHLIICSIYGICKNNKIKLNFEEILQKYKLLPYIKNINEFSRKIEINPNEEGDIIKFYNEIFIPAVKNFIMSLKNIGNILSPISTNPRMFHPQSEMKKPTVPLFSITSPLRETLNTPYNVPMTVNNKKNPSLTPVTKTLYSFGESLESPHKNFIDFKQKLLNNPRVLKRIDFDNNELFTKNKMIKKENKVEEIKLKIKPQFFNFKKKETPTPFETNFKNTISNFSDNIKMIDEKNAETLDLETSEQKTNKTPEFKK